jgi:hypothetical protein
MAATFAYVRMAKLLELLLPAAAGNTPSTVCRHTPGVGQRLDAKLQEPVDTISMVQTQAGPVRL